MNNQYKVLIYLSILGAVFFASFTPISGSHLPGPFDPDPTKVTTDTIPVTDNPGDFINDPNNNPFDILPSNVTETVEYDAETGKYILTQKIGEEYYRMPTYMTFQEYLAWREKEDQKEYFAKLGGISTGKKKGTSIEDPMASIDVANSLVDRLFGGTEVNIQPQGQVDVTMQSRYSETSGGVAVQPVQFNPIDPNVAIRVSVDGNIGSKLNLGFNYDTQSTFDFDRRIKLEYDTEAFGEDDIIKKIEAGNVSLPLRSNLIQGAQSLFGIKTELQFGHLRITALASQQQSEQKNITIENGAAIQEFELSPDEYDENRHFFLSHFHRDNYEQALENMPQINSAFRVADIEVWISDDRPIRTNIQNTTTIAALADLAESNPQEFEADPGSNMFSTLSEMQGDHSTTSVMLTDLSGNSVQDTLPANENNGLQDLITQNSEISSADVARNILSGQRLRPQRDFEVFQGRKLSSNEFAYNEQLGFISLNIRLRPNQVLAVGYTYFYSSQCLDPNMTTEEMQQPVYQVGQLSLNNSQFTNTGSIRDTTNQEQEPSKVLFTKLLKSSSQPTNKPSYDLMMKNVYSLRASQLDPQEFSFDIFYEDDNDGTFKKFLPEEELRFTPLLNLFNLDRLNKFNDPQADGVFDYVPGVTIIPSSGTVVFPVLEPFGSDLSKLVREPLLDRGLTNAEIDVVAQRIEDRYAYQLLYDTSITIARQDTSGLGLERNKFRMKGFVKSNTSGEINLGPFVPQGSVSVRAGGIQLVEGADYEIDYSLGRLRIINDSYLQQGTPINVSFEDQTIFSLQQKNMLGLRADYNLSKKASIGATMLSLSERPFTEKVNLGNDPINNAVYGLDYSYSSASPLVTKIVDKLPFYSTNAESSINFYAEGAYLRPGYSDAIEVENEVGEQETVVSIDDFEGAINGLLLGGFNTQAWRLASTPTDQPFENEANSSNDLVYGANRARLSWYSIDRRGRNTADLNNAYTRFLDQRDLFPDRDVQVGQSELLSFDLNYFPDERGPYNFDIPGGRDGMTAGVDVAATNLDPDGIIKLNKPESRWGGIMRAFQNPDFEQANYEFIEFWMLNPYMERLDSIKHATDEKGKIVIHLGNVSEDILKDGEQMYENALPNEPDAIGGFRETTWGRSSVIAPFVNGFDQDGGENQDLGFDGLTDSLERIVFSEYLDSLRFNSINSLSANDDPSGDDYQDVDSNDPAPFLTKSKYLTNPQGNAPLGDNRTATVFRGNRFPDTEDMNNNRSLDNGENYYLYEIPIEYKSVGAGNAGELDEVVASRFITDIRTVTPGSGRPQEKWYRFRIPISEFEQAKGITGFRSIQFMRMYMTGFKSAKTFRLAEFQILRNLWRKNLSCTENSPPDGNPGFSVDEVGIQENSGKLPFNYVRARNIKEVRLQSTNANLLQDEKSLALKFTAFPNECKAGINKLAELDLTLYNKMQLFVHAELSEESRDLLEDGDLKAYIKVGKDLRDHYYEYEIPLKFSDYEQGVRDPDNVWPQENLMTIPLDLFKEAKMERIRSDFPVNTEFVVSRAQLESNGDNDKLIYVKGTPSLSRIKVVEVGFKNRSGKPNAFPNGEVWVNELRMLGLSEKASFAGEARLQIQMADLGDINATANYSGIGWGGLDQRLAERNRRENINYDIATSLRLDKFFPDKWGLSIPFYAQYSKSTSNLQFEPYEGDLTPEEKTQALEDLKTTVGSDPDRQAEIDREIVDIEDRTKEQTTIKTFNFTNVKKTSSGAPKPWSPSNVSVSYAFTETTSSDPIIAEDKTTVHNTAINYNYSKKASYFQPFKSIKNKNLKLIKEINFNFVPNSFTFGTDINRQTNIRRFRLPEKVNPEDPIFQFDDRRFFWNRDYGLNWDLTKSLKFTFKAKAESIIDELRQVGIESDLASRRYVDENGDKVTFLDDAGNPIFPNDPNYVDVSQDSTSAYRWNNLKQLGRSKNYNHNFAFTYNLPIRYLPYMDWVSAKADYKGSYTWSAGALINIDETNLIGNTIQNTQSKSINATFSFDKLYSKSKYLKAIDRGKRKTRSTRSSRSKKPSTVDGAKDAAKSRSNKKKSTGPSSIERILIRPLLALRNIKASYREELGTMIPGFYGDGNSEAHGIIQGVKSPGLDFIAGGQPNLRSVNGNVGQFFADNLDKNWFNPSENFNGIFTQTERQTADLKIALEPIKDFDIDIDFKKSYTENYSDQFKAQKGEDFAQGFDVIMGSYNFTHVGLNTLFDDGVDLYDAFRLERQNISSQLANKYNRELIGGDTVLTLHSNPDFAGYYEGFGPENPDVAIPAFLKVYTGREFDVNGESLRDKVSKRTYIPAPNWTVKYDGLGKLEIFKDLISSFSIRHAYIGNTTVGSYSSNVLYTPFSNQDPNSRQNGNYYSEINTPALRIADQFAPLIGFSLKLKNEMTFEAGYNKSRTLNLTQLNLSESFNSDINFGFGYTLKNFGSNKASKKKRSRKKQEDEAEDDDGGLTGRKQGRGKVNRTRGRTLTMNLDFSITDSEENIYNLGQNTEPTTNRGSTNVIINPSVDYDINKNLTMRFFINYNNSISKNTVSVNRLDIRGGVTAQLKIN